MHPEQPENKNQLPMNPDDKNQLSLGGDNQYSYKSPLEGENESRLANFSIILSQLLLIDIILLIIIGFTMKESAWILGMLLFWPGVLIFALNIIVFTIHFIQSRGSDKVVNKKAKWLMLTVLTGFIFFLIIGNILDENF